VITNDFLASLSPKESGILEDMSAGYSHKEICVRHSITIPLFNNIRKAVQEKAVDYLLPDGRALSDILPPQSSIKCRLERP
jgi:hypothetical protein